MLATRRMNLLCFKFGTSCLSSLSFALFPWWRFLDTNYAVFNLEGTLMCLRRASLTWVDHLIPRRTTITNIYLSHWILKCYWSIGCFYFEERRLEVKQWDKRLCKNRKPSGGVCVSHCSLFHRPLLAQTCKHTNDHSQRHELPAMGCWKGL